LGDARLSLERESSQSFDLLAVDAFSGDAIPLHLVTREALDLYLRHLRPDGLLLIHTTNRYVDLAPAIEKVSAARDISARIVNDDPRDLIEDFSSWVVVAHRTRYFLDSEFIRVAEPIRKATARPWSDDYSDLIELFRWNGG
jgi:SAM-dependent methyltransferase